MLFQDATDFPRVGGWSESFYAEGVSAGSAVASAAILGPKRAALLPTQAAIVGARATDPTTPGLSASLVINFPGTATLATDVPQMALLCKLYSVGGPTRQLILRALPDARVVNGEYQPSQAFTSALRVYFTGLNGYYVRGRNRAVPVIDIINVTSGGLLTTTSDVLWAAGDDLKFFRTRDRYGQSIKGNYRITTATDTRHFQLANWGGIEVTKGKVRRVAFDYYPITNADSGRVIVRKVGKPFFGYVGHR
jgi:hypothetical protein